MIIHYTPRWPLMVHFACAIICFGMSTIYHLFCAHSKKMMNFWIKFDYLGICFMIAGSSTPAIVYSFCCDELENWRFFYLSFMWGGCTLTGLIMMIPYFDKDSFAGLRGIIFSVTGLFNLVPIFHIVNFVEPKYLHHFYYQPWLLGGLMYLLGAFFYGTKFPEKCCQGRFDIFGSSHQLMHILIVSAALSHYYGAI